MILLRAILIFLTPSFILRKIHTNRFSLGKRARIGFSIIISETINIGEDSQIGNGNWIQVININIGKNVFIGSLNIIRGKIIVDLSDNAELYKSNKISAPMFNIASSRFVMLDSARIAVRHIFDLTHDITIGRGVCIAGLGSQFWTHSFYYSQSSYKRVRVDKPIVIGDHCYIGSSVIVCAGVEISSGVTVGAGTCVAKNLTSPGLYVSSAIRHIGDFDVDNIISQYGKGQYKTEYEIFHS
ncbi:MAG: hypothetical protein MJZ13_04285 [Bacteroidales bacterium]|nr:hypothetical protein [Bacteroidales bacterium]